LLPSRRAISLQKRYDSSILFNWTSSTFLRIIIEIDLRCEKNRYVILGGVMTPRILVVDDEASIRLLYQEEFNDEGYEVDTAAGGLEAIEKIKFHRPDLVTLDIKMVGMDGLEVLARVREFDMELPIVLCTAYGSYRQDFGTWGSDLYVTKSSNLDELKSEIKRLLKQAGKL